MQALEDETANGPRGTTQSIVYALIVATLGAQPVSIGLAEEKTALRKEMARRRRQAMDSAPDDLAKRLVAKFGAVPLPPTTVASGYLPIRSELDPRPLMTHLAAAGWRLALPVVVAADSPLLFRAYSFGDSLVRGRFDTEVPAEHKQELQPRLLLVPLLAFDRSGYRLGYGGGFYDRTLSGLRAENQVLAVGVAFAAQEIEQVPRDAMDHRLDWIVTEHEAIAVAGEA